MDNVWFRASITFSYITCSYFNIFKFFYIFIYLIYIMTDLYTLNLLKVLICSSFHVLMLLQTSLIHFPWLDKCYFSYSSSSLTLFIIQTIIFIFHFSPNSFVDKVIKYSELKSSWQVKQIILVLKLGHICRVIGRMPSELRQMQIFVY